MKTLILLAAFAVIGAETPASPAPESKVPFSDAKAAFERAKDELLHNYYRDDLTEEDLYRGAVQGMLAQVDPKLAAYNQLLTPEEYAELRGQLAGHITGIGAALRMEEESGLVDVLSVFAGSPAETAGIVVGDRILAVDGQAFKGKTLSAVVAAIRGPEGQSVQLSVLRGTQVLEKTVVRRRVAWDPARHQRLPDGIELLTISDFSDRTPGALKTALDEIGRSHAKGLVIDLRNNHGGALEPALDSAKLLLPKGTPIARIIHRGQVAEQVVADGSSRLPSLPVVVLVNGETMSSAELLAAALRQGLRAPLMGGTTKGKWSIQMLQELPNHYVLKYTVGAFQSPDGKSFEGTGMPPDVEVALDPDVANRISSLRDPIARLAQDPQLRAAANLLELRP